MEKMIRGREVRRLASAEAVRGADLIADGEKFIAAIHYGVHSAILRAENKDEARIWKDPKRGLLFLRSLGIGQASVDMSHWNPA
jgi:hypothetical protein